MSTGNITFDNSSIPNTLSQTIYNYLKDAVVTNKLKANQRIIEKDIAKMFGVNTTVHNKIWDIIPNKILQRTIEFVHGQLMRILIP